VAYIHNFDELGELERGKKTLGAAEAGLEIEVE
jgi:hypothetical protein